MRLTTANTVILQSSLEHVATLVVQHVSDPKDFIKQPHLPTEQWKQMHRQFGATSLPSISKREA